MNVLLWFKRDLRIYDHHALTRAAGLGRILPLYIVEPAYWALPDTSARQWDHTAEALTDLRAALGQLGAPLIVRVGEAVQTLSRLCRQHDITTLISHQETGNLWTYQRDLQVAAWARGQGIRWEELPQSGVVRKLPSRNGWAGLRDAFTQSPPLPMPQAVQGIAGLEPGAIPSARALRLAEDRCPHRQTGGRQQALTLLDSFLTKRGESYRAGMSSPLTGERACSRLSAHLALGTVSGREVALATGQRQADRSGGRWSASLHSYQSRLAWRDHFMQKLEDQPGIEVHCLHRAAESLRPREPDATRLVAWSAGETGLPFVDACMRYLAATGWLNFRMRAMVMSVASYHLWLDWRATGAVLARRFTDYEPGIHWPQVQMQSGTTGINTPRIYNPVKLGLDQDPTGTFTRRWLPELADVPDMFLQSPWRWEGARHLLGRRYPEPIVDVVLAQRQARDAIFGLRKTSDREEIAQIIDRHASRADPRFVNDRSPRKRPARPSAQLSLDL